MDYLSPFHLIYDDPATADLSVMPSFQKIKRKLLARYELVDNEAIQIQGSWINRGDALKLIEDLKDEAQMDFHQKVFSSPELLRFLEEGDLGILENPKAGFSDSFRNQLSPYFSKRFGVLFLKAFKEADTIVSFAKFPLEVYVNEEDIDVAYSKIYSTIKSVSVELEQLHLEVENKQLVKNGKGLKESLPIAFIKRINTLPEYFEDARELIADEVHSLACRVNDDAGKYGLALDVLKYGSKIKVGKIMKAEYQRVYKVLKGNSNGTESDSEDSWGSMGLFAVKAVVIILIIIFRMDGCEDKNERSNSVIQKMINSKAYKQRVDSLLNERQNNPMKKNFKEWKDK